MTDVSNVVKPQGVLNNTFIVVYRPHGALVIETQHFGPYTSYLEAEEVLVRLGALGIPETQEEKERPGVKWIEELRTYRP